MDSLFSPKVAVRILAADLQRGTLDARLIPGLKILRTKRQLTSIPKFFHCDIPPALADEVSAAEPDRVRDVGVAWAIEQSQALLAAGVPSLHFYVMSSATAVNQVLGGLDL